MNARTQVTEECDKAGAGFFRLSGGETRRFAGWRRGRFRPKAFLCALRPAACAPAFGRWNVSFSSAHPRLKPWAFCCCPAERDWGFSCRSIAVSDAGKVKRPTQAKTACVGHPASRQATADRIPTSRGQSQQVRPRATGNLRNSRLPP